MSLSERLRLPDLDTDMQRVDEALRRSVGSEDPFLSEVASHLITAGGKRLRPALAVAAAAVGGAPVGDDVIQGGVAVELVHLGSLYHDDVMDNADMRHGVPSVNARWGNLVAIVAGDFLLARASEIAASLGTEVAGLLAATIGRLCEGQVAEVQTAFNPGRDETAYMAAIAGKTASLYSASCRIGAITAGLGGDLVDALTSFGHAFGMAFQIRDDVLDVIGTDETLGKPAGHDMVEGVYTLPVIRAMATPGAGGELRALLGAPLDEPARDKARSIVRSTDGVNESIAVARRFADSASASLAPVSSPISDELGGLAHRLLDDLCV